MSTIYLSGPMTGLPDLNYPAFDAAATALRGDGHEVYNPAEWERINAINGKPRKFNLHLAFSDYCDFIINRADYVVVLPGWENSPGATAETALARAIGKRVVEYEPVEVPECEGHNETQKRDGKPPWCTRCGWTHGQPALPARKVGMTAEERLAGAKHRPWSPETGYGPAHPEPVAGPTVAPPRSSMGDRDGEPGSTHQRAQQCEHEGMAFYGACVKCGQSDR